MREKERRGGGEREVTYSFHLRQSFVETLEKVANSSDPIQLFYKGEIAKKVVEEFKVNGEKSD